MSVTIYVSGDAATLSLDAYLDAYKVTKTIAKKVASRCIDAKIVCND